MWFRLLNVASYNGVMFAEPTSIHHILVIHRSSKRQKFQGMSQSYSYASLLGGNDRFRTHQAVRQPRLSSSHVITFKKYLEAF